MDKYGQEFLLIVEQRVSVCVCEERRTVSIAMGGNVRPMTPKFPQIKNWFLFKIKVLSVLH